MEITKSDLKNGKTMWTMKKLIFSLIIFSAMSGFVPTLVQACMMSKVDRNQIFMRPDLQFLHIGTKMSSMGPITSEINGCQKSEGQFLMFSIGVKRPGLVTDVDNISYDGIISENSCRIERSTFKGGYSQKEEAQAIIKQLAAVRQCLYLRVRNLNEKPIEFEPEQTACKVTEQKDKTIILQGDYCFLPVQSDTQLQVSIETKQECLKPEYLAKKKISAQDIEIVANAWLAEDNSGSSTSIEYLQSMSVRFGILASEKTIPLAENFIKKEVQYPTQYNVDINPGSLILQKVGDRRYNIDFSLEVKNRTKEVCVADQACSSVANYQAPVAGQVELFELQGTKPEYMYGWPFLAVAAPQYQGLVKNVIRPTLEKKEFEPNSKYRLVYTMYNPEQDYRSALKKLQARQFTVPSVSETLESLPMAPVMGSNSMQQNMPGFPTSMLLEAAYNVTTEFRKATRQGKDTILWPLYYTQICNGVGDSKAMRCVEARSLPEVVTITIDFTTGKLDPGTSILALKTISATKKSTILPELSDLNSLPRYRCD
jgi:hypothetical protein